MNKVEEDRRSAELQALNKKLYQEEQEKQATLKQQEAGDSFYQKLADGFDVNILIVGDSIGAGAGTETSGREWFSQLKSYIETTYKVSVGLTNVSMGGNGSYAGYVRTMRLDDNIKFDLAIICNGQNDSVKDIAQSYEPTIRAIETKYPGCSIVSILESSQREYTDRMTLIQEICEHYGIPVADTIKPFQENYDELTKDSVHPNDKGQDVYFNVIKAIVEENVKNATSKMSSVDVFDESTYQFDNFAWYDADSDFNRVDDVTFVLNVVATGVLGIDYDFVSGDNKADIYVDGELFQSPTRTFDYDFSQRHILVVSDDCTVKNEIKVVFTSKEQADEFKGMCFSWE